MEILRNIVNVFIEIIKFEIFVFALYYFRIIIIYRRDEEAKEEELSKIFKIQIYFQIITVILFLIIAIFKINVK